MGFKVVVEWGKFPLHVCVKDLCREHCPEVFLPQICVCIFNIFYFKDIILASVYDIHIELEQGIDSLSLAKASHSAAIQLWSIIHWAAEVAVLQMLRFILFFCHVQI